MFCFGVDEGTNGFFELFYYVLLFSVLLIFLVFCVVFFVLFVFALCLVYPTLPLSCVLCTLRYLCPVSCVPYVTSVLCLVYPMLPCSLDCPFLNAPSVFSNVYLLRNCQVFQFHLYWFKRRRYLSK
jgi:hypothetical protein